MSNPQHLHLALKALAPAGRTFYDDQAPGTATAPWLVGSLSMPEPKPGEAGLSQGETGRWTVTVAAETAAQARVIAQECVTAWAGSRVTVAGYLLSILVHRESSGPYAAGLTATDTNLKYQVIRLGFDLTASQVPTPA